MNIHLLKMQNDDMKRYEESKRYTVWTDQNEVGFCLKQEQISTSGVIKAILNAVKYNNFSENYESNQIMESRTSSMFRR